MVLEHILTDSVGKRVEKDFWSKCKKDRYGNPIVIGNSFMRVFAYFSLLLGGET